MMFAVGVVGCARENDVLGLELEQWTQALKKRGIKLSRPKPEYMCLNGTPLGNDKMRSDQLPQATEFTYM